MELIEDDIEIINSRLRLLRWLNEELQFYHPELKNIINKKGQDLPINL